MTRGETWGQAATVPGDALNNGGFMAIRVTKEHKEIAKREGHFLWQLMLDGRHLTDEQRERNTLKLYSQTEITGALCDEAAKELWDWYKKWQHKI